MREFQLLPLATGSVYGSCVGKVDQAYIALVTYAYPPPQAATKVSRHEYDKNWTLIIFYPSIKIAHRAI